jgi:hypothetical protein
MALTADGAKKLNEVFYKSTSFSFFILKNIKLEIDNFVL